MYKYADEKPKLLTEDGQRAVCEALLDAQHLAQANGLIPNDQLYRRLGGGDSFFMLAIIDRLIELGYLERAGDATGSRAIYRWIARSRT